MKIDERHLELAAYALGYNEHEYLTMHDNGELESIVRLEMLTSLGVSLESFVLVADKLLFLTPAINTPHRLQQTHAFVISATSGGDCKVLLSTPAIKNKVLLRQ